jgi:hypothetical protein
MTTRRNITAARLAELKSQLTDLDLAVLRSVSDLRFMTGAQLARLHFSEDHGPRARAARRALLRLCDLECLSRLPRIVGGVRAGSKGFVYVLGIAGQKLAFDFDWQPKRRGRRSQSPGLLFLRHCLDIAELHVLLVEADRDRRLELLELVAEPLCHRTYVGLGNQRVLKPDSFVRVGVGEWEFSYFIEVDRGTEGSRAIAAKLREYLTYEASGAEQQEHGVFPKVLWSVPDEARVAVIGAEIEQLPIAGRELFGVVQFREAVAVLTAPDGAVRS